MRKNFNKRGISSLILALFIPFGTASESGTNANEVLLDEIKYSLLSQSLDAGLSIASAGFIDSTGRLVESTYFRTDSAIDGLRNKRLVERRKNSSPAVERFLESISQEPRQCNNYTAKYRKEINVFFEENRWGSSTDSNLKLDIEDIVRTELKNDLYYSSKWYSTRDPQDIELADSTRYFAAVSPANTDARAARYVIQVHVAADRGNPPILQGLRTIRSVGTNILLASTNSQILSSFVRKVTSSAFKVTVDISLIDSLNGNKLASHNIQFYTSPSKHNLMPRRLSAENRDILEQGLARFLIDLEAVGDCDFEESPISVDENYEGDGITWVRVNKGSSAGIRLEDRFILSSTHLMQRQQLLDPEILQSIVIGEVMEVNHNNSVIEVIAGEASSPFTTAIPF
ncbi:MAG: hypothetical protein CMQ45_11400 [Gammaproteobacteria bacterium]|nr:hypothetical protein [Gammaproteobacteria bacterium]